MPEENKPYQYDFPRPLVSVDAIVFRKGENRAMELLLIKRGHPPFEGQWAFPGGFVNENEDIDDAVGRELQEETGLCNIDLTQLQAFGKPGRDPRGHCVTIAYWGIARNDSSEVKGGDDAAEAKWFPLGSLPKMAFDHSDILEIALTGINSKKT